MNSRVEHRCSAEVTTARRSLRFRAATVVLSVWPEALCITAGCFTSIAMPEATAAWYSLAFDWGVVAWGASAGGRIGVYVLRAFDLIPCTAIAATAGMIIGLVASRRPVRLAILYGAAALISSCIFLSPIMSAWENCQNIAMAPVPAVTAYFLRIGAEKRRRTLEVSTSKPGKPG